MEGATKYLIAVPQALANVARGAAVEWDAAGALSMFHNPTLYPVGGDAGDLFVFSYGWISNEHAPAIQAALAANFPRGVMVAAHPFEAALQAAVLQRVVVSLPA